MQTRKPAKPIIPALMYLALCLTLLITGCADDASPDQNVVRPVRAIRVGDATALEKQGIPGQAQAADRVDLAFRVTGSLVELPAQTGMNVNEGDLLARIDPIDYQTAVANLEAETRRIEAEVKLAEINLEKVKALKAQQAATDLELNTRQAQRDALAATLESMQSRVDQAKLDLSYTEIKAPFTGVISEVYVDNFQRIESGQVVVRMVDVTQIEMVVDIPEQFIGLIPTATDIYCVFDAFPDVKVPAEISEIGIEPDAANRTYPVTLSMNQPEGVTILPGMSGLARGRSNLDDAQQNAAVLVPLSAVHEANPGQTAVWIFDEATGQVASRDIEVIETSSLGLSVTGVKTGEWVVTAGVHYLQEGQVVRLLNQNPADTATSGTDPSAKLQLHDHPLPSQPELKERSS